MAAEPKSEQSPPTRRTIHNDQAAQGSNPGRILSPGLTIVELKLLAPCALSYNASGVENCDAGSF